MARGKTITIKMRDQAKKMVFREKETALLNYHCEGGFFQVNVELRTSGRVHKGYQITIIPADLIQRVDVTDG